MQESQSKPELFFEVRNISKSFLGTQALKNVSLSVRAGQVHAVIGENGAGKSTLMNIISGKMQPDSGELLRDGKAAEFSFASGCPSRRDSDGPARIKPLSTFVRC